MKITKQLREDAAVLCAIAASTDWCDNKGSLAVATAEIYSPYGPVPDKTLEAGMLAWKAERVAYAAWRESQHWTPETHWAEAEAMLRTGWTP
jgi:hypothetical protein